MAKSYWFGVVGIVLVMGLGFEAAAAGPKASKSQGFKMLEQTQFLKLSRADQMNYLRDVRELLADIDKATNTEKRRSRKLESLLQLMLATTPEAQAAPATVTDSCNFKRSGGRYRYCVTCETMPSGSGEGDEPGKSVCGNSAKEIYTKMNDTRTHYNVINMDEAELTSTLKKLEDGTVPPHRVKSANGKWVDDDGGGASWTREVKVTDKVTKQANIEGSIVTLSDEEFKKRQDALKKEKDAGPAVKMTEVKEDGTVETTANRTGEKLDGHRVDPPLPSASERMKNVRELRDSFMKDLRCIYAGTPIIGKTCTGESEFVSDDGKTYSCTAKKDDGQTVAPSKYSSKKSVICNPLLFGLDANNKPYCIAKSSKATENCSTLSDKDSGSLARAINFHKENPEKSRQIRWALTKLCDTDEAGLTAFFEQRKSDDPEGLESLNAARSAKDIVSTCKHYGSRFSAYYNNAYSDSRSQTEPSRQ